MSVIETGIKVLQRTASRVSPNVRCLDQNLFPDGNGPLNGELLEITGESNSGKSCLVLELIARIILPEVYGGHGAGAVFIDCDNNTNMMRLLAVLEKHLVNSSNTEMDQQEVHRIREEALSRLTIIKCYTLDELEFTMLTLDDTFVKHPENAFLLEDSIAAFYWSKCTEAQLIRMETYLKMWYTRLKKLCQSRDAICICTRPSYFGAARESTTRSEFGDCDEGSQSTQAVGPSGAGHLAGASSYGAVNGLVDHRIELVEITTPTPSNYRKFNAFVSSRSKQWIHFFMIDAYGINWLGG